MYTVTLDIIPSLKHGFSHKEISKGNSVIDCKILNYELNNKVDL